METLAPEPAEHTATELGRRADCEPPLCARLLPAARGRAPRTRALRRPPRRRALHPRQRRHDCSPRRRTPTASTPRGRARRCGSSGARPRALREGDARRRDAHAEGCGRRAEEEDGAEAAGGRNEGGRKQRVVHSVEISRGPHFRRTPHTATRAPPPRTPTLRDGRCSPAARHHPTSRCCRATSRRCSRRSWSRRSGCFSAFFERSTRPISRRWCRRRPVQSAGRGLIGAAETRERARPSTRLRSKTLPMAPLRAGGGHADTCRAPGGLVLKETRARAGCTGSW